jgi:hypothetical protein
MNEAARETPGNTGAVRAVIRESVHKIGQFVCRPEFQALVDELFSLDEKARPNFVLNVILNEEERRSRGIVVPDGMIIQRSTFADNRPTLFCITQRVPLARPWDKVTITFDNPLPDKSAIPPRDTVGKSSEIS